MIGNWTAKLDLDELTDYLLDMWVVNWFVGLFLAVFVAFAWFEFFLGRLSWLLVSARFVPLMKGTYWTNWSVYCMWKIFGS